MKKVLLFVFIGISTLSNAQSSIQPNVGFNFWKIADFDIQSYMEFGVQYELGITDQLGLDLGVSYNTSADLDGFIQLSLGGRYNFNELNDGAFVGVGVGYGFLEGYNTIEFGSNFGYSIPLGPGSLNPSIGLGYLSFGSDGFRLGGLHIPLNVSYSIVF